MRKERDSGESLPRREPKLSGGTQIRRDIGFDPLKFFGGERKSVQAFEELARAIAGDGRVAAEKDAVHSDLAHSPGQQRGALFPHSVDGKAGRVEIKTPDPGISAFDRLRVHAERLVDRRIVAAPP